MLPVIAAGAYLFRAAGGALLGLGAYLGASAVWSANDWSTWWGISADDKLVWMAIGIVALTLPKFAADLSRRRSADPAL